MTYEEFTLNEANTNSTFNFFFKKDDKEYDCAKGLYDYFHKKKPKEFDMFLDVFGEYIQKHPKCKFLIDEFDNYIVDWLDILEDDFKGIRYITDKESEFKELYGNPKPGYKFNTEIDSTWKEWDNKTVTFIVDKIKNNTVYYKLNLKDNG